MSHSSDCSTVSHSWPLIFRQYTAAVSALPVLTCTNTALVEMLDSTIPQFTNRFLYLLQLFNRDMSNETAAYKEIEPEDVTIFNN